MQPALIKDKAVDRVEEYKYFGTIFDKTLNFQQNTEAIIKRFYQMMFALRFTFVPEAIRVCNLHFIKDTYRFCKWLNSL